jgi:hypothetical protein
MDFNKAKAVLLFVSLVSRTNAFLITAAPEPTYVADLLKRGVIDTWGYISGASGTQQPSPCHQNI